MPKKDEENLLTVEEIQSLRDEISLMHSSLAKDVLGHAPLVKKVVERFISYGLEREWVEKLLATLVGSEFEDDESILVAYVLEELDTLLKVEEESKELSNTVRIIVGATGIGKTSLVGKLAARYAYYLHEPHKVAMLNFDQHKVGAVEQLENYATAMGLPLIDIIDSNDEYDVIFVDTAGSFGDELRDLENLISLIESNTTYRVEISLALAATPKMKDLKRIYNSFEEFPIKNLIFTKLDETCDLSDMMNFLITEKTPVAYLSTGQAIPEDLVVATKEYILNRFMN